MYKVYVKCYLEHKVPRKTFTQRRLKVKTVNILNLKLQRKSHLKKRLLPEI